MTLEKNILEAKYTMKCMQLPSQKKQADDLLSSTRCAWMHAEDHLNQSYFSTYIVPQWSNNVW